MPSQELVQSGIPFGCTDHLTGTNPAEGAVSFLRGSLSSSSKLSSSSETLHGVFFLSLGGSCEMLHDQVSQARLRVRASGSSYLLAFITSPAPLGGRDNGYVAAARLPPPTAGATLCVYTTEWSSLPVTHCSQRVSRHSAVTPADERGNEQAPASNAVVQNANARSWLQGLFARLRVSERFFSPRVLMLYVRIISTANRLKERS